MKEFLPWKAIVITFLLTAWNSVAFAQTTGEFTRNQIINGTSTPLYYYVPLDYTDSRAYKLILNLEEVSKNHFYGYCDTANAILVSTDLTRFDDLSAVVDFVSNDYAIDLNQLYLTGFSSRGYDALIEGLTNPDFFKGIIALAPSRTNNIDYEATLDIPVCLVTGASDIFLGETQIIYQNISNVGGKVDSFIVNGVSHEPLGPDDRTPFIIECFDRINSFQVSDVDYSDISNIGIWCFPNPVSNRLTLQSNQMHRVLGRIEIYNSLGLRVYHKEIKSNSSSINVSAWLRGCYFVYNLLEKHVVVRKIMVK